MIQTTTRREQIASMTTGTWPDAGLIPAVTALADDLVAHGCGVPRAEVSATVHVLYAVSASPEARDYARERLLKWADMLDALDCDAELMDGCRRCGPSPV